MKKLVSLCSLALIGIVPVASAATVTHGPISCVPAGGNAKIVASADGAASARVYFKSDVGTNEYYVEMLKGPEGFWAILPQPAERTSNVSYRIVARDAEGNESAPVNAIAPVSAACAAFALDPAEQKIASNLVVGQTAGDAALVGFRCEGVTNTITVNGQMKPYTNCDDRAIAALAPATAGSNVARTVAIIGVGAAGATISAVAIDNQNDDRKPVSPILP